MNGEAFHLIFSFVDHVALVTSVAEQKACVAQLTPLGGLAKLYDRKSRGTAWELRRLRGY